MKTFLLCAAGLMLFAPVAEAGKFNRVLDVGDKAPGWDQLLGVDGKRQSLGDLKEAKLVVLVFISNRCPATKKYQERLLSFHKKYAQQGVQLVAINSNREPTETFAKMIERAKTARFPFPYLHDPGQDAARAWGATHTPHFFVIDAKRNVAYMGAFDDHLEPEKVEERFLPDVVDALLAGKQPEVAETRQVGCEIEFAEVQKADRK